MASGSTVESKEGMDGILLDLHLERLAQLCSGNAHETGQVQLAPQPQVSPQRQPARRAALLSWHPHAQVAPAQEPQLQGGVFFVI